MRVIGFNQFGGIDAEIDGQLLNIPDDMANRHRMLIYEWEMDGHTIPAYAPPATSAALLPLTPRQLLLALLSIGVTQTEVEDQLLQIQDEDDRARAMIEWQSASTYERNHPTIVSVAENIGIPAEQVDVLWRWAMTI